MTKKHYTVDTWVLEKCNEVDFDECVYCVDLLTYVFRKGKLCLDAEEEIDAEYLKHIRPRTFLFQWWQLMIGQAGHICRWSNKLDNKHQNNLMNKLSFHDDDMKFIGVAVKSIDKTIVTGDSDYNSSVCEYLANNMNIQVTNPRRILE